MSIRRMSEEWRRLRTLDRDAVGRLLLVALAAEQYVSEVHQNGGGGIYPLEYALDVANGLREASKAVLGTKTIETANLAQIALKELEG